MKYDCIIIGAGAAGLFYAAADTSSGNKLILEKTSRPGQKLLLSGSGMCNITHGGSIKDFIAKYGDKGGRIRSCLYKHNNLELMNFFESGGVHLVEREDGKVFPQSLDARDILDFLLAKATDWQLKCNSEVTGIKVTEDGTVNLALKNESTLETRKLVIATGGASYPATGSDGTFMEILRRDLGIDIVDLRPALAPVFVQKYPFSSISGVSIEDVIVSCNNHMSQGPLLFTHKGFSGPSILHISQYAKAGMKMHINFIPECSEEDILRKLKTDQPGNGKSLSNYLSVAFALPKSFADLVVMEPNRKFSTLSGKELAALSQRLTDAQYSVSGCGGWNEAMVTAGGVSLDQMDMKTMKLKKHDAHEGNAPDIRIIGEALDVNGDTGGYNLQFAWSSAMAASPSGVSSI